jgi:8-oxo-dGTP diphosphatase
MSAPVLVVNVVLFRIHDETLQVLLADSQYGWALPGAEAGGNESLEDAAQRAITTLLDRRETYLEQLYTYGDLQRDPGQRVVCVAYFALVTAEACPLRENTARWTAVENPLTLAFNHSEVLAYALRRLRYKLEYSAVGFQLLPGEFTLSELQHTYEIILGERLDKRNFRRRILQSGIIEGTARLRSGEGRPARLYRYRPDAVAEIKARRLFP